MKEFTVVMDEDNLPPSVSWPTYEDGAPVLFGDATEDSDEVCRISFTRRGFYFDSSHRKGLKRYRYGERVKRPAPKVIGADGNRIETGMDVWWICEGDERGIHAEKLHVEGIDEDGMVECSTYNGGTWIYLDPSELHVKKPVLDADGVPIKVGDTVYLLPGEWCGRFPFCGFHGGEELEVFAGGEASHVPGGVQCREKEKRFGFRDTCYPQPSQLTHTKPEQDSWEKLWVDIEDCTVGYETFIRRCKALAERGE